jgi:hypothetical protein
MNKLPSGGVAITATSATPLHRYTATPLHRDGQPVRLSSVIDRRARAASSAQGLRCVSMPTKRRRGGRHHCKAVKLAASVLAGLAGELAASDTFGIDRRTIRGWVKHEDVPTGSWAALDELAGAQLLERVARGEVTNGTILATVRGIASRNRGYTGLIARRELGASSSTRTQRPSVVTNASRVKRV